MQRWARVLLCGLARAAWAHTAGDEPFSPEKVSKNLQGLKGDLPTELADDSDLRSPTVEELTATKPVSDAQAAACGCLAPAGGAKAPPGAGGSLVQRAAGRPPRAGLAQRGQAQRLHRARVGPASLLQRSRSAARQEPDGCGCTEDEPTEEEQTIDGEVIYLNTCTLTQQDLQFWSLVRTEYLQGGIMLPSTYGYVDSCDMCNYNNLQCGASEAKLEKGYCMCTWRVNGADPVNRLVQCGRCVTDCVGRYLNFDLGTYLQPVQQKGICIRKKSYFVLN